MKVIFTRPYCMLQYKTKIATTVSKLMNFPSEIDISNTDLDKVYLCVVYLSFALDLYVFPLFFQSFSLCLSHAHPHTQTQTEQKQSSGRFLNVNHLVGLFFVDNFQLLKRFFFEYLLWLILQGIRYCVLQKIHQSNSSYFCRSIFSPMDLLPKNHGNKHNDCIPFCKGNFKKRVVKFDVSQLIIYLARKVLPEQVFY